MADFNLGNLAQALKVTGYDDPELLAALDSRTNQQPWEAAPEPVQTVVAPAQPAVAVPVPVPVQAPAASPKITIETQPQQPAPTSVVPDANIQNQALEIAGSPYRVPVPTAQDIAPFNPNQKIKALKAESTAGKNDRLGLTLQQGDIAAEGYDKQATLAGGLEAEERATNATAKAAIDKNRADKAQLESEADKRLRSVVDRLDHPPDRTMERVFGIIGAILSIGGNKGAASGMQMLGSLINKDAQKYADGLAADQGALDLFNKQAGREADDSEHEARLASQIHTLSVAPYQAALTKIAAETNSKETKRAALDAASQLRNQYVDNEVKMKTAQGIAGNQKKLELDAYRVLSQIQDPRQRELVAGQIGPVGMKVWKELNSGALQVAELGSKAAGTKKTEEETKKLALEAAKGPQPKTEYDSKVHNMLTPLAGADGPIARLEKRIYANGKELPADEIDLPYVGSETRGGSSWVPQIVTPVETLQHDADVNTLKQVFIRARSGAGVKADEAEDELRNMGIYSRDSDVAAQGLKQLVRSIRSLDKFNALEAPGSLNATKAGNGTPPPASLKTTGYNQAAGDTRQQARAAVNAQSLVEIVNPETGDRKRVTPALVSQYQGHGYIPTAVPEEEKSVAEASTGGPLWPGLGK